MVMCSASAGSNSKVARMTVSRSEALMVHYMCIGGAQRR